MRIRPHRPLVLLLALGLTACTTVGPDYRQPPNLALPSTWEAPQAAPATPADNRLQDLNLWWNTFADPALNALLTAAQEANPTLDKAAAAIAKARANRSAEESAVQPTATAGANAAVSGSLHGTTSTTRSRGASLDASWELDLFGKTRRAVESAAAELQARQAEWHDARLSLAAEVADAYVDYRATRLKLNYYRDQATSQAKTCELTQLSAQAGFSSRTDALLADASLSSTRGTALAQEEESEILIKTLTALTGMPERKLRRTLGEEDTALPHPREFRVTTVPADLLRQRPDVVAAERGVASANARIGVAEAAKYPSLTLAGSIGLADGGGTTLPWSFGPSLTVPLFNGGRLAANVKSAEADYVSALADYRQTVRAAVKEVEQALVRLDSAARREEEARRSAAGYRAYLTATEDNWRAGRASLLDVETARRSTLTAEVNLLELQQNRLRYWIALYKAVGGGWNREGDRT